MFEEKLRPCPFCGGEARLQLTDDEGNFKDESYLENPYSGVGYVIMHDTSNSTSDCPIATDSDSSQGIYIYESKEEAIITWNKRDCNDLKMPQINFIPLKQGITEDELNEYMVNSDDTNFLIYLRCKYKTDKEWEYLVESATCGFDDGIIWLNDWDEGQQDVEYLAITKIGEIEC